MNLLYKFLPLNRLGFEGDGFSPRLELSFSGLNSLNDPSECSFSISKDYEESDMSLFTEDFSEPKWENKGEVILAENYFKFEKNAHFKNYGVLSLSREIYSTLMWALYASGHKGFAIEIDEKFLTSKYKSFRRDGKFDMIYSESNPSIIQKDNTVPLGLLYWKYKNWEYEKECRFVKKNPSIEKIDPRAVKEIIFGYNTPPHVRIAIMQLAEDFGLSKIKFKKVSLVNFGKVEIIEDIPDSDLGLFSKKKNINIKIVLHIVDV